MGTDTNWTKTGFITLLSNFNLNNGSLPIRYHHLWHLHPHSDYNECFHIRQPAHAGALVADFCNLKMEAIHSSETSVQFTRSTWCHIPEYRILHRHRCENLKSYKKKFNYRSLSVKRALHLMLNKTVYSQTSVLQ
jgi:hypothetical protein